MLDIILWLWLAIFFIFLVVNIFEKSTNFGAIAGIVMLLLGLMIITDGIQVQGGETEIVEYDYWYNATANNWYVNQTNTTMTTSYTNVSLPYGTWSLVWGVPFLLIGTYMLYANMMLSWKKRKGKKY